MSYGGSRKYIEDRIREEDHDYTTPCWVWQRCLTESGYARAHIPGFSIQMRVHRAAYEIYVGPIPEGLTIDHLCKIKCCVNPAHLEPVTALENIRRAGSFRGRKRRTPCSKGHEIAGENRNAHGSCRLCANAYMRAWEKKNPDKVIANRLKRRLKRVSA